MIEAVSLCITHKTLGAAQAWAAKLAGPSTIVHLWHTDGTQLFAVVQANEARAIHQSIERNQ